MRVWPRSGLNGTVGGFLEPAKADQRHGAYSSMPKAPYPSEYLEIVIIRR